MASDSAESASTGSRPAREAQPLCPFCKTPTVVERISRTLNHPDMPFYTCRNRDWGSKKCAFFMWKPSSAGTAVDPASVMAALECLQNSVSNLTNEVSALKTDVSSVVGQGRVTKCMNVATVLVGIVSFVLMCMLLYHQSSMSFAL